MQLSTEHILTTHAGSLPRPDDLAQMLYALLDDKPVDQAAMPPSILKHQPFAIVGRDDL